MFGLQIELVGGRDFVGLIPSIDIAHRVASVFSGRMSVGCDLLAQRGFTLDPAPSLGKRQKKTLLAA
jgi:hypothetical protein